MAGTRAEYHTLLRWGAENPDPAMFFFCQRHCTKPHHAQRAPPASVSVRRITKRRGGLPSFDRLVSKRISPCLASQGFHEHRTQMPFRPQKGNMQGAPPQQLGRRACEVGYTYLTILQALGAALFSSEYPSLLAPFAWTWLGDASLQNIWS